MKESKEVCGSVWRQEGEEKLYNHITISKNIREIIKKESATSYIHYSHNRLRFVGVLKKRIVFKHVCLQVTTMTSNSFDSLQVNRFFSRGLVNSSILYQSVVFLQSHQGMS